VTQTINSSFRHYIEIAKDLMQTMYNPLKKINPFDKTGTRTEVPTAAVETKIQPLPPKDFAEKFFNIQQWTKLSKGGHFAAMEQPELLAEDIRKFATTVLVQIQPKKVLESTPV
jgi:microsomal epoxide hydrolase